MSDVFISYSHKDKDWKDLLVTHLRVLGEDGQLSYWHDSMIAVGQDWSDEIERAIQKARIAILLVSADALCSEFILKVEVQAFLERRQKAGLHLIPLILRPCGWRRVSWLGSLQAHPADGDPLSAMAEPKREQALSELVGMIADHLAAMPARSHREMPPHNLPFRSIGSAFVGREDALNDLHRGLRERGALAVTQPHVLHGLGGIGKSRLALEYAWRYGPAYRAVGFVVADTVDTLRTNLAGLGPVLKLTPGGTEAERLEAVLAWLAGHDNWLLIVDNVDDPQVREAVYSLLPGLTRGKLLVTSRLSKWRQSMDSHALALMEPADAKAYLLLRSGDGDEAGATTLAEMLGYLPLALELAGAYMVDQGLGSAAYLAELETQSDKMLGWHDADVMTYPWALAATWQHSEKHLSLTARAVLRLAAHLAPEPMPANLFADDDPFLQEAAAMLAAESGEAQGEPVPAREAVAENARFSLVTRVGQSFSLHRMPAAVQLGRIPPTERNNWLLLALRLAEARTPVDTLNNPAAWPGWREWHVHAAALLRAAFKAGIADPACDLVKELSYYLQDQGLYSEAVGHCREYLAAAEADATVKPTRAAMIRNSLALALQALGLLAEAAEQFRQVLAVFEAAYEAGHPHIATVQSNLGWVLKELGDLNGARALLEAALAADEQSYPPGHPSIAIRQSNLGMVLQELGDLNGARALLEAALAANEQCFPHGHPNIAGCQSNLGLVLKDLGDLNGARVLLEAALAADEQSYPPGHPSIARSQHNLGCLLVALGERDKTRDLLRQAHAARLAKLGPDHAHTKASQRRLDHLDE